MTTISSARRLVLLLLLGAASGCSEPSVTVLPAPSAEVEPFHDQTMFAARPDIHVYSDGKPLRGVLVHLRRVQANGDVGPVLTTMLTNADGHATSTFTRTIEDTEVAVVLVKTGYAGELPEDFAEQLGDFAPAAQFTVPIDSLTLGVDLEKMETP